MSKNLMETVAPQLAPPVTRQPVGVAPSESEEVTPSIININGVVILFAADDDD